METDAHCPSVKRQTGGGGGKGQEEKKKRFIESNDSIQQ